MPRLKEPGETSGWLYLPFIVGLITAIGIAIRVDERPRDGAPRPAQSGVGNLLPARVRTICVDMVESVPVKLGNRGSMQAIGLVTDVGFFLERLAAELETPLP